MQYLHPSKSPLKPNEKQTIRVAVRRPKDLTEGEYKSHLKFKIVPHLSIKAEKEMDLANNEIGLTAKVYASYSIPVVYRVGEYDTNVSIGTPEISRGEKTPNILINFPITRTGKHGIIGLINVYHKDKNGKETEIGNLGNANIFSEITKRDFTVITQQTNLSPGQLRITYSKAEGSQENYKVLDEQIFPIE